MASAGQLVRRRLFFAHGVFFASMVGREQRGATPSPDRSFSDHAADLKWRSSLASQAAAPGQVVEIVTPGGGYGPPGPRLAGVARDVAEGRIHEAAAGQVYGGILNSAGFLRRFEPLTDFCDLETGVEWPCGGEIDAASRKVA